MARKDELAYEFYQILLSKASEQNGVKLFQGKLTEVFDLLDCSRSYYSAIRQTLENQGCIEIVVRGSKHGGPSIVMLDHPPEMLSSRENRAEALDKPHRAATIRGASQKRFDSLEVRIAGLESWREAITRDGNLNILDALVNLEGRLKKIEDSTDSQ